MVLETLLLILQSSSSPVLTALPLPPEHKVVTTASAVGRQGRGWGVGTAEESGLQQIAHIKVAFQGTTKSYPSAQWAPGGRGWGEVG